jgi:hypothetical protein
MREDECAVDFEIAQDNDPHTQCRPAKRIKLLEVRRLI